MLLARFTSNRRLTFLGFLLGLMSQEVVMDYGYNSFGSNYGYQSGGTNQSSLSWTYGSSFNSQPCSWNRPLYGGQQ